MRDYTQLNQLQACYPRRLVVLGFPCNQFGYQVSPRGSPRCPALGVRSGKRRHGPGFFLPRRRRMAPTRRSSTA